MHCGKASSHLTNGSQRFSTAMCSRKAHRHDHRITPTLKSTKPLGYLAMNKIAKKAITVTIQNASHKEARMM